MKRHRVLLVLLLLYVALALTACVIRNVSSGVVQYFDEDTGATVVALAEPMIFAAGAPQLASNARDYVYLGPVEASSGGQENCYPCLLTLLLPISRTAQTSIDRQVPTADAGKSELILLLDREPMELTESLVIA